MKCFRYLPIFLFLMFFMAASDPAQAKTRHVTGDNAKLILDALQAGPYIKDGDGKKVVYVVGAPEYANSMGLYAATYELKKDYQFRWYIIQPQYNESIEDKFFGVYESRSPEDLARIYTLLLTPEARQVPVKDKAKMKPMSQLARSILNILVTGSGESSFSLPMLAIPTEDGITVMDEVEEMGRSHSLIKLIDKAAAEPKGARAYDLPSIVEEMAQNSPLEGYYCAKDNDTKLRLFPVADAPALYNMSQKRCYEAQVALDNGWIGVKFFLNPNRYGYAYVKADQVRPR